MHGACAAHARHVHPLQAGCRDYVIGTLPQLAQLDGKEISKSERIKALQRLGALERELAPLAEMARDRKAERRDSARSSLAPSTRSPTTPRVAATPPWNAPQTPSALEPAAGSCSLTGVNLALEAFALESPSPVRPQPNPPTPERGLRDRTNTPPRRAVPRPKRRRVPMHLPMPVLE